MVVGSTLTITDRGSFFTPFGCESEIKNTLIEQDFKVFSENLWIIQDITEVKPYDNKETKDSCFIFEMENIVDNENNDWLNLKNNKDKHENELTAFIESLKNIDDIGNLGDIKVTINATIDKLIKEKEREIKKFQGYTNWFR